MQGEESEKTGYSRGRRSWHRLEGERQEIKFKIEQARSQQLKKELEENKFAKEETHLKKVEAERDLKIAEAERDQLRESKKKLEDRATVLRAEMEEDRRVAKSEQDGIVAEIRDLQEKLSKLRKSKVEVVLKHTLKNTILENVIKCDDVNAVEDNEDVNYAPTDGDTRTLRTAMQLSNPHEGDSFTSQWESETCRWRERRIRFLEYTCLLNRRGKTEEDRSRRLQGL